MKLSVSRHSHESACTRITAAQNRVWHGYERPMFINLTAPQRLGDTNIEQALRSHVLRCYDLSRGILSNNNSRFTSNLFFPSPGFPDVKARLVREDDILNLELGQYFFGAQVDLQIPDEENAGEAEVAFGSYFCNLSWKRGVLTISSVSGSASLIGGVGPYHLSLLRCSQSGPWGVFIRSGDSISKKIEVDLDTNFISCVSYRQVRGSALLIQINCLGMGRNASWLPDPVEEGVMPISSSAPEYVLRWELQARRIWHFSLDVAVAMDALNQIPDMVPNAEEVRSSFFEVSKLIFAMLKSTRYWRPSAALSPKESVWERGNWANGFLVGSFGIHLALLASGFSSDQAKEAGAIIVDRGLEWLRLPVNEGFTSLDFPPVEHWLTRSTNHGIVILASAVVGLRLAAEAIDLVSERDEILLLEAEFVRLCKKSFDDGFYPEGIRYAQFCLQEICAYILQYYCASGEPWQSVVRKCLPDVERLSDFFWFSGHPFSSRPFATWGDCPPVPWKHSVIGLLASADKVNPARFSCWLEVTKQEPLEEESVLEDTTPVGPLAAALQCAPRPSDSEGSPRGQYTKIWKAGGLAVIARDSNQPARDWRLWLLATRVHRTHNVDHDLGSFFLNVGGSTWIGEERGRQASAHSTIALLKPDRMHPEQPEDLADSLMFGGLVDGRNRVRDHSGIIQCQEMSGLSVISAVAPYGLFRFEGNRMGIRDYRVDIICLEGEKEGPGAFLVLRQAIVSPTHPPCHNMVFPSSRPTHIVTTAKQTTVIFSKTGSVSFLHPMRGVNARLLKSSLNGREGVRLTEVYDHAPELLQTVQLIQIGSNRWQVDLDCQPNTVEAMCTLSGRHFAIAWGRRGRRRMFSSPKICTSAFSRGI